MEFLGYRRPDGKAGVRNKVLILPASICASDTAGIVAQQVEGTVTFHNQNGCSQVPSDMQLTMDVMAGMAANPNVYGTVVISLGCETCQMDLVTEEIRKRTNKPLERFVIQENHGTITTVEKASRAARAMVAEASMQQRIPIPVSELVVATECGGSDQTSGLVSNPLIGEMCDRLVDLGATAVLSETTEFIGAEHILARRARTPVVKDRIYDIVHRYENALKLVGEDVREGNPSPGNMAGGLTTLEEKSLGCIHKGGHRPIEEVYDYAKPMSRKGLVIMDTPGNDPSSVAGMAAGGAQLVVFSTGRGTPTGNPIVPVIKITANQDTYHCMEDNIDCDVSVLLTQPERMGEFAERLLRTVVETADGKRTKSEILGLEEMAIARVCNYV
ncbi:altronate dehydratase [Caproiciproducens sp. NJN-50]|uniref:UxaA family hydrolase n=1 Tax=Caproiciproducens sp. NJN-50 TaxID=2507162 RepID=UPI000FFE139C|nr:UxaA family hydrolase [Caproiciproducens sp. NJN-50]QAT50090.1 altronate dehydratase [Caproiciproducens sp. NJN-50]